jgi:hypothetical protein
MGFGYVVAALSKLTIFTHPLHDDPDSVVTACGEMPLYCKTLSTYSRIAGDSVSINNDQLHPPPAAPEVRETSEKIAGRSEDTILCAR